MIFKVRKEKSYFKNQLNIFIRRVQDYCLLKKMQATIRDLIISLITQDGSIYLSEINQMSSKGFVWQRYKFWNYFIIDSKSIELQG